MTNDKITLSQLETFLFSAAEVLRGKICAKASLELQIRCSIQLSYGRKWRWERNHAPNHCNLGSAPEDVDLAFACAKLER